MMISCTRRHGLSILIASLAVAGAQGCRRTAEGEHLALPAPSVTLLASATASAVAPAPAIAIQCPPRRWLTAYDFAPDGQRLVTACDSDDCDEDPADTTIDVWDLAAGRVARTLQAPSGTIRTWWAGAGLLVAQSRAGTGLKDITLWETRGFNVVHDAPHYCAYPAFDRAARRMLITGCDGAMKIIDVGSRSRTARPEGEAHLGGDYSVSGWFSHDGRRVYVDDEAFGLQALDTGTLRRKATVAATRREGNQEGAPVARARWAPETDRFALLAPSGALQLLRGDLSVSATLLPASATPAREVTWVDEQRLALFHDDGAISILDLANPGAHLTLPPAPPSAAKCAASLTTSPRRSRIAFQRTDCEIELLDAGFNKQWSIPALPPPAPGDHVAPWIAFSPDDRHLAAAFGERSLVIYDAGSGAKKAALTLPSGLGQTSKSGNTYRPLIPTWSPDGRFAVVAQGEVFLVRPGDGAFVVLSMFQEAGKRVPVVSSEAAFDGPAGLDPCAFQAVTTPRAPRRAEPRLFANFLAGR